eukprot:CAMPEP_0172741486 /NCGR_PEP_ID=MMETSP1074-20121228/127326_1 /TAXON_ID=2916 /ORGANISM="Ceratium fusus, Strain PA161109" /LENGTH=132 /DNA_ID=CAMNT_0013571805 /DNA_START=162 /DNA_END=561 /DNA_ORIENTATION=-
MTLCKELDEAAALSGRSRSCNCRAGWLDGEKAKSVTGPSTTCLASTTPAVPYAVEDPLLSLAQVGLTQQVEKTFLPCACVNGRQLGGMLVPPLWYTPSQGELRSRKRMEPLVSPHGSGQQEVGYQEMPLKQS